MVAILVATQCGASAQMAPDEPDAIPDAASLEAEDLSPDDVSAGDLTAGGLEAAVAAELAGGLGAGGGARLDLAEFGPGGLDSSMAGIASYALFAPVPSSAPTLRGGSATDPVLLFGGYDVWRNGHTIYSGLHWAANGLDHDGFVIRLSISNSAERYFTPRRTYVTDIFRAAVMPGWRFKVGAFELKLFGGPDFEHHNLTPAALQTDWRGPHLGLRIGGEAWAQPIPELMLAASFDATTIAEGFGFRAAAGWRLLDAFWLGPEFYGSRDELSRQTRFGLHMTGLQSGPVQWSAAMGVLRDSLGRDGNYARLAAQIRP
ncbi:cellulose biosynthesis protein BcsS [Rhodopseudomonas sp. HC1]|uniref:cellulose biosynthesis protein BcsS n=1 Tax=Rhodopseudomonas infernalis TaxID=2897386 RepID=UPI001EE97861|nr:cellulose biosynthesis protein BcsS [Rhodopseudomonas infernalis]MCG6207201.1 cellulose biosynthesis protein BcsS [Rhodopseudomonas infernalis]